MANEIKLTQQKENVESYEVTEILVQPGQSVEKDQPLIVVNADKSTIEVTSPAAGKVSAVKVKVGEEIKIGTVYIVLEGAANGAAPKAEPKPAAKPDAKPEPGQAKVEAQQDEPKATPAPKKQDAAPEALPGMIAASPATRWLARKMGVDLTNIRGTGPKGRVTEEDVKNASGGGAVVITSGAATAPPLPDFSKFGEVQKDPLSKVRKLTAAQMSLAWSLIPHVTQNDNADITELEAFRKAMDAKGVKLTVTAIALKACAVALKMFPTFNSSLDLANNQLILKKYINIGVAVDTKGGLLVPVIKDVASKGIEQLAKELNDIAEAARSGKADMSGGTFTITNLGGIGGTGFTPIVNHPEVAILGMSRSKMQPVWQGGAFVPRLLMPLSLSYDHRVIDGAAAARFTRKVAEMLENPWMMLM